MEHRLAMMMLAVMAAAGLGGCNETFLPPAETAVAEKPATPAMPAAEPRAANERASIRDAKLTAELFMRTPQPEKLAAARSLISRAWGQDCQPFSVSEVIGGAEKASWRVDCAGGEISTSSGGVSPDYLIDIPNEPDQPVIVNQCARRDGALACDTAGRDRS
jgi:hypothetical protein